MISALAIAAANPADVLFAVILACAVGALVAGFATWLIMWVPNHTGSFYFCEVYQERDGKEYLVKTVRAGLGAQTFNVGKNYQFVIPSPAPVLFYRNGRPVLHYILNKARPRVLALGKTAEEYAKEGKTGLPEKTTLKTPKGVSKPGVQPTGDQTPDTESRSVKLFFGRGAIEQMIRSTRNISFKDVIPIIVIVAFTGLMLGYVISTVFHPGLVQAPPPGYYYKAFPVPTNSSTVIIHT